MKKLSLVGKFSLISFVALLLIGISFGWLISANLESNMVTRSSELLGKFIRHEVGESLITADLSSPISGKEYDRVKEIIRKHYVWMNVVQIKIWSSDASIIWSYDKNIIGKRFPDNDELAKALKGEIVSELVSEKLAA
ncbi:MAG: hypothetical protein V3R44_04735, partial [bacterium]